MQYKLPSCTDSLLANGWSSDIHIVHEGGGYVRHFLLYDK